MAVKGENLAITTLQFDAAVATACIFFNELELAGGVLMMENKSDWQISTASKYALGEKYKRSSYRRTSQKVSREVRKQRRYFDVAEPSSSSASLYRFDFERK